MRRCGICARYAAGPAKRSSSIPKRRAASDGCQSARARRATPSREGRAPGEDTQSAGARRAAIRAAHATDASSETGFVVGEPATRARLSYSSAFAGALTNSAPRPCAPLRTCAETTARRRSARDRLASGCRDGSPLDEPHRHEHDGRDEQQVDEPPQCVGADQAEHPQHEHDGRYRPKHETLPPCLNLDSGDARSSGGDEVEERFRGMAERARLRIEEADLALDVQLLDVHFADGARLDILTDAHAG